MQELTAAYIPDSDAAKAVAAAAGGGGGPKASIGQGFQNDDGDDAVDSDDDGLGGGPSLGVPPDGDDADSCGHCSGSREDLGLDFLGVDELREKGRLPTG